MVWGWFVVVLLRCSGVVEAAGCDHEDWTMKRLGSLSRLMSQQTNFRAEP
jgi:hypothetical protein